MIVFKKGDRVCCINYGGEIPATANKHFNSEEDRLVSVTTDDNQNLAYHPTRVILIKRRTKSWK